MIILRLLGGLGNQLFIYAFGRMLEIKYNLIVYYDIFSAFIKDPYRRKYDLKNFNIKMRKVSLFYSLFFPMRSRIEPLSHLIYPNSILIEEDDHFKIDKILSEIGKYENIFIQGYFQKNEYPLSIEEEIRKEISLKIALSLNAKNFLHQIHDTLNPVAVHIRGNDRRNLTPISFFKDSFETMKDKLEKPKFFIFSDDIDWCTKNFSVSNDFIYVSKTKGHIEDFWLMKNCKHFIISESTFSWWASWLAENQDKIIISPLSKLYN